MQIPAYYLTILRYLYEHRETMAFHEKSTIIKDSDGENASFIASIFEELFDIGYLYEYKGISPPHYRISLSGIAFYESLLPKTS